MGNVETSYLRLKYQAGEQQCTLLEMREKMLEEANAILLWGGYWFKICQTRKGANVRRVFHREKVMAIFKDGKANGVRQ